MTMARKIPITTQLRCDFDHQIIGIGKFATQVTEGEAQGIYHGRNCYEAALGYYRKLKQEEGFVEKEEEDYE